MGMFSLAEKAEIKKKSRISSLFKFSVLIYLFMASDKHAWFHTFYYSQYDRSDTH